MYPKPIGPVLWRWGNGSLAVYHHPSWRFAWVWRRSTPDDSLAHAVLDARRGLEPCQRDDGSFTAKPQEGRWPRRAF